MMRLNTCYRHGLCRHWAGDLTFTAKGEARASCAAFKQGIPQSILRGEHDHRQPYAGDNGIRYEPINK